MINPLFPSEHEPDDGEKDNAYLLPRGQGKHIAPLDKKDKKANPAAELARRKIAQLYHAPSALAELAEAEENEPPRSAHQKFMQELSTSGKSLAEIQTAWHEYYQKLSDDGKREVWQEFYAANNAHPSAYDRYVERIQPKKKPKQPRAKKKSKSLPLHGPIVVGAHQPEPAGEPTPAPATRLKKIRRGLPAVPQRIAQNRSVAAIKEKVLRQVRSQAQAQIKAKQHVQSLVVGLASGSIVLLVLLFGFFNEVVIAPFIQPSSHAEATPIILSQGSQAPSDQPEVIIPKINVELPIVYGNSDVESDIENSLEAGVAHYPGTSVPGQRGNAAFFGHSSNNILNKGKYKFAFVLLHEMVPGDIFYLANGGKLYTYRVFQKKIVDPSEVDVLYPVDGKTATATLITCDPPGTSWHRLVVWGEQIDPDPNANSTAPAPGAIHASQLPSNGPTLWSRFWHWLTPW